MFFSAWKFGVTVGSVVMTPGSTEASGSLKLVTFYLSVYLLARSLLQLERVYSMIQRFAVVFCLAAYGVYVFAQGPRPSNLGASKLDLGEPGIQWYTTWESAEAEAKRSGRAIMFVAAATQCHGVSGVF